MGKGEVIQGVEWAKVKYTHSGDRLRIHFEHQLRY
jgi:hypothetical protein